VDNFTALGIADLEQACAVWMQSLVVLNPNTKELVPDFLSLFIISI